GISLTVRGRATEKGAEGDIIGVLNEETKRVVHGVVVSAGRVRVEAGTTQVAATDLGTSTTGAIGGTVQP
ncbi:MAG TPA: flagella basal body P-ring formation protein FlgA, partial [Pseudolabrys sp.]|nr:flagella basal body P-ring formation protein FlgA [Pseudolabrys sp.]